MKTATSASAAVGASAPLTYEAVTALVAGGLSSRRLMRLLAASALDSRTLVQHLADASIRIARTDLAQAERLAQGAMRAAAASSDAHARGRAARGLGHVQALRGQSAAALIHYEQAISEFERAGSTLDEGITRSGALQTLIYLGRYQQALDWAARARGIFDAAGDTVRLARLDSNVGNVLHRQDRLAEALTHYERALAVFRAEGGELDAAIALRNIAVCQITLQQFHAAYQTYQQARDWCQAHGLDRLLAEVDYNIAYLHYLRGEYATAIDLYARARTLALAQADPYHAALCDLDESELYLELNLVPEGASLAAQAARQFDALGMQYEASKARTTMALAAGHRGRLAEALALFDEARARFVAENNAIWPAHIDLFKAALIEESAPADAYALCQAARRQFAGSPLTARTAACDVLLARLALRVDDLDGAAAALDRARAVLPDVESPALAYRVHVTLGQVFERRGDTANALGAYRQAHAAIEGLRRHLDHDELKVAFLEDKRVVFESLVALLAAQPAPLDLAGIFALVEQSKSRSLAEQLALLGASASSSESSTGPAADVRDAAAHLHAVSRQLREEAAKDRPDRTRLATLRQDTRVLQGRLTWLASALEGREAATTGATVPLDRVQASLPDDTLLIEYHEVRGTLHALAIDRRRARLVPLVPMDDICRRMRLLRFQLGSVALDRGRVRASCRPPSPAMLDHLAWFHDALLAPLAMPMADAARLVLVPHGVLHALPFHAIGRDGQTLLDTHVVSYAPSASVHFHAGAQPARPTAHAVVLGIPDALAPAIGAEAEALASLLPDVRLALGAAATRSFLEMHAPGARFVHVATHGRFRHDNPLFSSIRLADGDLRVLDLAALRLSAELVSLSGCGTGLSVSVGGDELLGLTRALLSAGARAVMVSLWDVHDQTTASLMVEVFRRLVAGEGAAEALRAAMIEARREAPDPFYWAPFILLGHPISFSARDPLQ